MKNNLLITMRIAAAFLFLLSGISVSARTGQILNADVQQNVHTVKGVVKDAAGPMAGVSVIVKGTGIGVVTDENGSYSLKNVPEGSTLQFLQMGYKTAEAVVGTDGLIDVTMVEDQYFIDELVVIGYGSVRKSDVTGSVASVDAQSIGKSSTSDPIQALQGRAAGVQIITATGSPDAVAEIKIRGTGSPNGSDPLFVVDGFPMNDINYLSPEDIQSIEILKDASACAIYGSRGANGVVMITTRQAESGVLKVNVKAEFGVEAIPSRPKMMNSSQYAEMVNLANAHSGIGPKYVDVNNMAHDTDWFDEVMRPGIYQNYNMTLSGGTKKISTIFTANFFSRQGTVKSTDFRRLNFNQKTTYKPFAFLTMKTSFSGSFSKSNVLGANGTNNRTIFLSSLIAPPDVPVWNELTDYYSGIDAFRLANPAGVIARNAANSNGNFLLANISADIKIFRDLTFTSRFGYKWFIRLGSDFSPIYKETSNIASGNNSVTRSTLRSNDWTWENMLNYTKTFNRNHELSAMVAMSARDFYTEQYSGTKRNLPSESEVFRYFDAASDNSPDLTGNASSLGMLSWLGRINYNLLNRYLFTVSFRADGSSRFLGRKKWGYFPSGAFAWKISEEPFFKNSNQKVISNMKLRLGWGQIGNERISSYYPYQTGISQNQYYIIGDDKTRVNGTLVSGLGNPDLQWETSEQANIGLDMGFLSERLTATVDAYIRKTDNILLNESVPRVSGSRTITRNVGGMQNKGIEIAIGWKDDIGDFSYGIDVNASFVKNEVTNLGASGLLQSNGLTYDYALIDFQGQFNNIIRSVPGLPYGLFYGYDFLGIFQNQQEIDNYKSSDGKVIMPNAKPGDSKFRDTDGDGKISSKDMVIIGDPNPVAVYGLNLNFGYKGFDFSMLFQGTAGNDIFNASKFYFCKFDGRQNTLASSYKKGWDGEGTSNSVPIVLADSQNAARNQQNWWQSSMYVEDGSYFRLKNLQLGYTFGFKTKSEAKPSLRVYFSASNVFTVTRYSGVDPEVSGNGVDGGQYPQPRTFIIGLNFNL